CGEMTAQYSTETKPVPPAGAHRRRVQPRGEESSTTRIWWARTARNFDFNGRPDKAFCLLTDRDLHVNMLSALLRREDRQRGAGRRRQGSAHVDQGARHRVDCRRRGPQDSAGARGGKQQSAARDS
ncbi:hypothetical protein CLOP_g23623, partial [Closterium sp. NIES-67]